VSNGDYNVSLETVKTEFLVIEIVARLLFS
jgi:hypothetical protein